MLVLRFYRLLIGGMKVKFNKQVTVDFLDHHYDAPEVYPHDKTFYSGQIVEVDHIEETVRGFVVLIFSNEDAALGIPKQGLTVLTESV